LKILHKHPANAEYTADETNQQAIQTIKNLIAGKHCYLWKIKPLKKMVYPYYD